MPSAPKWFLDFFEKMVRPRLPMMVVSDVEMISPSVRRIRFNGKFATLAFRPGCYMDFRVAGTEVRKYTIARVDDNKEWIEIIAHLHGPHPGSAFMGNLKRGDKVDINAIKPHKYYDGAAKEYLIFGDETSLGLACSLLQAMKRDGCAFRFYFELDEENKDLPGVLQLENYATPQKKVLWNGQNDALRTLGESDWRHTHVILTGNAASAQNLRKALKKHSAAKIILHGYWLEGKRGL